MEALNIVATLLGVVLAILSFVKLQYRSLGILIGFLAIQTFFIYNNYYNVIEVKDQINSLKEQMNTQRQISDLRAKIEGLK